MAKFSRLEVINTVLEVGLVPLFYNPDPQTARNIVAACQAGGARVIEFTNRGDSAYTVFTSLAPYVAHEFPKVILGVGSVVDAPTAAMYIAAGANFIVGPIFNEEIARLCNRRKIAYMPGCGTLTEISKAEEMGVEIVKLFPGESIGGPAFVKAILGPSPWTRAMPTGGVDATQESIQAWFKAGVACVGMGSKLITKEIVSGGNYDSLTARVTQILGWIQAVRSDMRQGG
ncbi:MAG: bifunctional 4-hydroxy-2-oxoglutarate aldolase/2-dehydro-3-deoxy-phosphogluconate aldolase [Chloroflexota bacterium]|nr:MAG: bifunctional 4-hydroxy-2-oxoglutarate aldolase/2-dehydro-3-deoxy-phosphogluconate aldolase [Chloroflexota bacterium]